MPNRVLRVLSHGLLGWLLFPFRYLDLFLLNRSNSVVMGNHCYLWIKKHI